MNKVIYDKGQIKIINKESNSTRGVLSYADRITLETLINKYMLYKTKFKAEVSYKYMNESEKLNKFINEHNVEDYYMSQLEDNRQEVFKNLYDHVMIPEEFRNKLSNGQILNILDAFEYYSSNKLKNASEVPINALELNYWFTQHILMEIGILLYRNGYEQIPIEVGDFVTTYYSIMNSTGNTLSFPHSNIESGKETKELLINTLLKRYHNKIDTYIRLEVKEEKNDYSIRTCYN